MKPIIITYRQEYSFRERALLWLLGNVIPVHAKVYSRRPTWGLTREDMLRYPAGSLGHELGLFLTQENLQPVDRVERHDAFHILLDFTTSLEDEAAMQFFLVGNGKISPFTLATAAFTALVMPDKWGLFSQAFRRGRQALSIADWNFLHLLDEPFADVKAVIFHQPVRNARLLRKIPQYRYAGTDARITTAQ
jgi:ubiquinone biosynthesis protein Coq4